MYNKNNSGKEVFLAGNRSIIYSQWKTIYSI